MGYIFIKVKLTRIVTYNKYAPIRLSGSFLFFICFTRYFQRAGDKVRPVFKLGFSLLFIYLKLLFSTLNSL